MKSFFSKIVTTCCIFIINVSYSQTDTIPNIKKNEINLNYLTLITIGAFDISYEKLLKEDYSLGISNFISFNKDRTYRFYSITPYVRNYFANNQKGTFIEAFAMLEGRDNRIYDELNDTFQEKANINTALGIAIGRKFVSKKGIIIELSSGLGRILFKDDSFPFVGRGGVKIGKRF